MLGKGQAMKPKAAPLDQAMESHEGPSSHGSRGAMGVEI